MVMAKRTTFQLDITSAGLEILQTMAAPVIKQAAEAVADRARSMAGSMTSKPPTITVTTRVGTIKRGVRAIATVAAEGTNPRTNYIGHEALAKAKDAGRV